MSRLSVALVNMPFAAVHLPSLGLSLLKAALERDGHRADVHYLNLPFAAQIGYGSYHRLVDSSTVLLLAEWVFAEALFGTAPDLDREYLQQVLPRHVRREEQDTIRQEAMAARAAVPAFLDACMETVAWERYQVIGFTSVFQQNVATLALARRLKERYPEKFIILGGANMEGVMGHAVLRAFPFVDAVCSGEGDLAFPELIRRMAAGGELSGVPGVTLQAEPYGFGEVPTAPVHDMDSLPYPSYDDYFAQLQRQPYAQEIRTSLRLLFESARGCWWGAKSHCTFCGLNGGTIAFRSKSPGRALAELRYLLERYQDYTRAVSAVDNIIDMNYFREFLPALKGTGLELSMFYETKANLNRSQVQAFAEAGVEHIQPGIESLSSPVLALMRKGITALQNVQVLKWCREFGVEARWNHLSGFPGEDPEEYRRIVEWIPALTHLNPPKGLFLLRLDRFSPYFTDPAAYGMTNVRPHATYRYVYRGVPAELLPHLAYYFEFDYADGRQVRSYIGGLQEAIAKWRAAEGSELFSVALGHDRVVFDLRPAAERIVRKLSGPQRLLYEYCDAIRSRAAVRRYLAGEGYELSEAELSGLIQPLLESRLMLAEAENLLSLAIPLGVYSPGLAGAQRFLAFLQEQRREQGQEETQEVAVQL